MTPEGAKRVRDDTEVTARRICPRLEAQVEDVDLREALMSHVWGGLVDVEKYGQLEADDPIFHLSSQGNSQQIARKLEGLVIQSGKGAMYVLKAEV
ncbi:hypothetical protein BGX31_004382, partial [Mortierella sp. GBA43]